MHPATTMTHNKLVIDEQIKEPLILGQEDQEDRGLRAYV